MERFSELYDGYFPIVKFLSENDIQDIDRIELEYNIKDALNRTIIELKKHIKDVKIDLSTESRVVYLFGKIDNTPIAIRLEYSSSSNTVEPLEVIIYGQTDHTAKINKLLTDKFLMESSKSVRWWYLKGDDPASNKIFLPPSNDAVCSILYPDITPTPDEFIYNYINSNSSILLLAGPPGTGKTSLLRYMIRRHQLEAHIVYDETLMNKDAVFQSFLFSNADVMIIEDADTILSPRETDKNKLMSRFLNVSDGLVKFPRKKIIFSTNITDFGRIDHALTRPGRCYGTIHTRQLNLIEAQSVAKKYNLSIPLSKQEYTLAELFNNSKDTSYRKIGFV